MGSFKKRNLVLLIATVMIVFSAFSLAQRKLQATYLEGIVGSLFSPFQRLASAVGNGVHSMFGAGGDLLYAYKENELLRAENTRLQEEGVAWREVAAENMRLKAMLDYKMRTPQFELLTAMVIGRDFSTWSNAIVINRGSANGVAKDMVVITPYGLVGAVSSVTSSTAKVQLLTDPRSAVGALVQRPESRVASIVEGNATQPNSLRLVNIGRDADIIKGDQLVTSGFGGIYPKGLAIGEVLELANDEGGLLKYAVVRPAVHFDRLEEVQVILKAR